MSTRTYKVTKPSQELRDFLLLEYKNDKTNKYSFENFYWYWSSDKTRKVYGCLVYNNGKLWSNPQI